MAPHLEVIRVKKVWAKLWPICVQGYTKPKMGLFRRTLARLWPKIGGTVYMVGACPTYLFRTLGQSFQRGGIDRGICLLPLTNSSAEFNQRIGPISNQTLTRDWPKPLAATLNTDYLKELGSGRLRSVLVYFHMYVQ